MQHNLSASNLIVFISFLDLFGVSMVITCLSSYVKSFDVSTTTVGVFFSIYGGLQLLSSYVVGYLSDRYGQLTLMIACSLLTSVGYATMGMASSFQWLCLSRCITGLFKHTQSIGRALIASSPNENAHILGYFSSLGSAGFIIGPVIGGWMYDNYGFKVLANINAGIFLIISLLCILLKLVGASSGDSNSTKKVKRDENQVAFSWKDTLPSMWDLFVLQFIMGFSMMIFRTNYSYTLRQRFDASGTATGLITSCGGVVGTISSLLAVHVSAWYGQAQWTLLLHLTMTQSVTIFICAVTPFLTIYAILQTSISFVNAIARECFLNLWFSRTNKDNIGKVIGMSGSLMAFARLVSPFLGGFFQEFVISGPMYAAFLCSSLAVYIISRGPVINTRKRPQYECGDDIKEE